MTTANTDPTVAEQIIASDVRLMREEMKKPLIRLPGEDWLISQFAVEVSTHVFDANIYLRGDDVVVLVDGELRPMTPKMFRTWVERHLYTYRLRMLKKLSIEVTTTMSEDIAAATLASPQFRERLLRVQRINRCRLPVLRADGRIELLPTGYDPDSRTLTIANVDHPDDMPHDEATVVIEDLLSEFRFTDQRSKAVAVAGLVGTYAAQVVPDKSLRPCFILIGNAEGCGKTLCVLCMTIPVLGDAPTGCKADEDSEIRKLLLTAVREARPVIFFDNVKGHLSSESLEAFLSAPTWSDRKLGVNESVTGQNLSSVFITGNGITISGDMRRRSLFIELHLDVERAEDLQFRRPLDLPTLVAMRPRLLAALWSLVRHWDSQGRPAPSRSHSAFPSWANVIGGIVEAAGWECPLATAQIAATADPDGDDMRVLAGAMAERREPLAFADVVTLAKDLELFENVLDFDKDGKLKPSARSTFGRILGRYDRRLTGNYRVSLEGKNHKRRYHVEPVTPPQQGQQGQQGLTNQARKSISLTEQSVTPCQTLSPCSDRAAEFGCDEAAAHFTAKTNGGKTP